MKKGHLILTVTAVCMTSCAGFRSAVRAPSSPAQLGEQVAQALLEGNTNAMASCLPPLEVYTQMLKPFVDRKSLPADAIRVYHLRETKEMLYLVSEFPGEIEDEYGFSITEVTGTTVEVCNTNSTCTDIILTFKTESGEFEIRLDECVQYKKRWYVRR